MLWMRVIKKQGYQPTSGNYREWKQELATEANNKCVYCAIHENSLGGIRTFHVEHFRPKSKFEELVNIYTNLFYACPICNTFKSNDWPNEPVADNSIPAYIDPSLQDYNEVFDIDSETGLIQGNNVAARYMLERMYLNRPQLINERKISNFLRQVSQLANEARDGLAKTPKGNPSYVRLLEEFSEALTELNNLREQLRNIPRYRFEDVRR